MKLIACLVFICSSAIATASTLEVSCQGTANASLQNDVSENQTLNPRGRPFQHVLAENQIMLVGTLDGGCGQFGCPSRFQSLYELRFVSGQIYIWDKELHRGSTSPVAPQTFYVSGYRQLRTLECVFHESNILTQPPQN